MLLEFPSELATIQAMTKKRKAVTDEPGGNAGEFQRWKKVRSMDPYPVLEQIVGQPNAQFRGQQGNVIQAITKGQSPICAVEFIVHVAGHVFRHVFDDRSRRGDDRGRTVDHVTARHERAM
jgi:hypothetical protein